MDDLVAFLRARLNEDERAAQSAASVCGCHPEAPSWSFDDEATDGRIVLVDEPHPRTRRKIGRRWNGSYEGLFMAQHVVRHDPARVLREVAAKRRIVDRYAWLREHGDTGDAAWVLPLLALPYADHPDYRPEWAPTT